MKDMICFEDFLPQGEEVTSLQSRIAEGKLVHALMITGEPGTGKRTLAALTASALMCRAQTGIPCGECAGCRMAASGEHPDITVIEKGVPLSPETAKGRSTIPVDDIREMIRICSQYPFEGGNRAVIVRDAENMTEGTWLEARMGDEGGEEDRMNTLVIHLPTLLVLIMALILPFSRQYPLPH